MHDGFVNIKEIDGRDETLKFCETLTSRNVNVTYYHNGLIRRLRRDLAGGTVLCHRQEDGWAYSPLRGSLS